MLEGRIALDHDWSLEALRAARVGFFRIELATQRIEWSAGLEDVFRTSTFDGDIAAWAALVHPDDRARVQEALQHSTVSQTAVSIEYRLADQAPGVWIAAFWQPTVGADGTSEYLVGVVREASGQRQALDALVEVMRRPQCDQDRPLTVLVDTLVALLSPAIAYVATFDILDTVAEAHAEVVAGIRDGEPLAGYRYALAGTPCASIYGSGNSCFHRSGVQQQFPDDVSLAEAKIDAYAGASVAPLGMKQRGILVAMWRRPVSDEPNVDIVMRVLAALAGGELVRAEVEAERRVRDERLGRQREALAELSASERWRSAELGPSIDTVVQVGIRTLMVDRGTFLVYDATADAMVLVEGARPLARKDAPELFAKGKPERVMVEPHRLDVPVRVQGQLRGLLRFTSERKRSWHGDEVSFSGSLGDVVSSAILNAERRSLEIQLQHTDRLETVGRLAGGIAHDFNNLLTAIDAAAALAQDSVRAGEAVGVDLLEEISEATSRASQLTKQLLTFARRQPARFTEVDISKVVLRSRRMLRRLIGEDVHIAWSVVEEPLIVVADPAQFEQVLVNLVVNARDSGGSNIRVATSRWRPQGAEAARLEEKTFACLEVSDDGSGMPPDVVARVFEPFFTTKGAAKGSGLGLATSYGIVRQASGDIRVESAVGQGTTFRVLWPMATTGAVQRPTPTPVNPNQAPHGEETLLLVEDDRNVRRALARGLKQLGYEVLVAPNAEVALELARERSAIIDAVISDVVMPGRSGLQLAEELRHLLPAVPTLLMSGYTADDDASSRIVALGITFLQKPFTPATLASTLRRALAARA